MAAVCGLQSLVHFFLPRLDASRRQGLSCSLWNMGPHRGVRTRGIQKGFSSSVSNERGLCIRDCLGVACLSWEAHPVSPPVYIRDLGMESRQTGSQKALPLQSIGSRSFWPSRRRKKLIECKLVTSPKHNFPNYDELLRMWPCQEMSQSDRGWGEPRAGALGTQGQALFLLGHLLCCSVEPRSALPGFDPGVSAD